VNTNALSFDHYAIFVRDLARSTEFYAKVMGLERIPEPFQDDRHVWFRVGGNLQLHIISPPHNDIPADDDVHFAFSVPSLKEFIAHLESKNVAYGDQQPDHQIRMRPDGIPQIYFQDPDGYWIEVNEAKY
jgi:lactoylglutathione lyase